MARQLLDTVRYIHQRSIIHTDFKTENILLAPSEGSIKIKVVDFGSALNSRDWHPPLVGTMQYRPPEMALQAGWSFPLDLWGVACIFAELYTGRQLFPLVHDDVHLVLIQKLMSAPLPQRLLTAAVANVSQFNSALLARDSKGNPLPRLAPARPDKHVAVQRRLEEVVVDPPLLELLRALFALEPGQRPTAAQALDFPFFRVAYPQEGLASKATTQVPSRPVLLAHPARPPARLPCEPLGPRRLGCLCESPAYDLPVAPPPGKGIEQEMLLDCEMVEAVIHQKMSFNTIPTHERNGRGGGARVRICRV